MDRSEIRRIKIYIFAITLILITILILNAMYESIITDPDKFFLPWGFYIPLGYLFLLILFLIFILSIESLAFKFIQIKTARSFEKRKKLIKNYRTTAQSALVTTVVILIILLGLNFLPFISDSLRTEDTFNVDGNEEKGNRFEEQDAFGLTQTSSIIVNSNETVSLKLISHDLIKDNENSEMKIMELGNHTKKDIPLSSPDYQIGYTLNKKHYFYIKNIGNNSVSGELIIEREISKPFVFNVMLFMLLFIITSIVWLVYLGVIRKKYETLHEEKVEELTKLYEVKPYTIDDVFFIYQDGTLINHQTRRIKPMDNDILSGMLTAIKDFVRDAFKAESKGELSELKYGKLKILIEHGEYAFLAVVISGKPPRQLRMKMKNTIKGISKKFNYELKNYKGEVKKLAGVKAIIQQQLLGAEETESTFDESSDSAWNNKGVVLTKLGKYHEALDCFDKALKINPGVSNIWLNRGIALVKLSEFNEAMDCFDRALQLDPNNDSAKRRRNKCWYKWKLLEGQERQMMGRTRPGAQPKPRSDLGAGGISPGGAPASSAMGDGLYDEPSPGYTTETMAAEEPPPRCPNCGQPLRFVDNYDSWYCDPCDRYPYDE